ncbi:MAG: hypothetical protein K2K73_03145, partial [Ureaplasma sp.]|nr:hypothetical protein [Ureaplasma sp.]
MNNDKDKLTNNNDYDLILEEKEKQLKKEKRERRIIASSLLLLLLLGSTAVVAPIISVAVSNDKNTSVNNANNIPHKLEFTNQDIESLILNFQKEVQSRKLTLKQFKNDFVNITKKYLTASGISIGILIQNATIQKEDVTENSQTKTQYNIVIELSEKDREYNAAQDLTPKAKLENNILSLTLIKKDDLVFFQPNEIMIDKLNNLKKEIQNYIDTNKNTQEEFNNLINNSTLKNEISNWLGIDKSLIGEIKYEQSELIITPNQNYSFISNPNSDFIINGNIVVSDLEFFKAIEFINLDKLFSALNKIIHTDNKQYKPEEFKEYLVSHFEQIKRTIYDNLEVANNSNFDLKNILDISLNDQDELIISLNNHYFKY